MSKVTHLFTIDAQVDFTTPTGALFVPGADKDMERLSKFLKTHGRKINKITATLDSHQAVHIAHPMFWADSKGKSPDPFTVIKQDDVLNGAWRAAEPRQQSVAENYVTKLAENNRYQLMIWPPHCLIGSVGCSLHPEIFSAFNEWEMGYRRIQFVPKGNNWKTEHYSAVVADVIDDSDPTTKLNVGLCQDLGAADEILITGEALSHCVANSIRDVAAVFGDANVQKFTLITDTCANVTGCEFMGEAFVKEMVAKGMKVTTTKDWN